METAGLRQTSGHKGAHKAGDGNEPAASSASQASGKGADPQPASAGEAGSAAHPERPEGAKRAGGLNRMVIASYTKFKGVASGAEQAGAEQGKKPVPVPPALMIGAKLDVRA
jgi:hypothetical protein